MVPREAMKNPYRFLDRQLGFAYQIERMLEGARRHLVRQVGISTMFLGPGRVGQHLDPFRNAFRFGLPMTLVGKGLEWRSVAAQDVVRSPRVAAVDMFRQMATLTPHMPGGSFPLQGVADRAWFTRRQGLVFRDAFLYAARFVSRTSPASTVLGGLDTSLWTSPRVRHGGVGATRLGDLLRRVEDGADVEEVANQLVEELDDLVTTEQSWISLAKPVREHLRNHTYSILSLLVGLLALAWAIVSTAASDEKFATLLEEHGDLEKRLLAHTHEWAQADAEREEQLKGLAQAVADLAAQVEQLPKDAPQELDRRVVVRRTRFRHGTRSRSKHLGWLAVGQEVVVLKTRRKWAYVIFVDVLEGVPRTGWVLKKYLRPSWHPRLLAPGR